MFKACADSFIHLFSWVMGKVLNSAVATVLGKVTEPIGKLLANEPKLPDFPALKLAFGGKS